MSSGAIVMPILTTFDDKGSKSAIKSLKELKNAQIGGLVSAGALVDMARRSIIAANQDAASQKQLALALRNNAGANDYAVSKSEDFISKLQMQVAVADDELRPALANLATVTHDTAKAQDLLKVALDVATFSGKDLGSVTLGLTKAYQGNVGGLRRMGLAISDTAIKNKDFNQALIELKAQTDGAAAAAAAGAEGGWKKLGIVAGELNEMVGKELNVQLAGYVQLLGKIGAVTLDTSQKQGVLAKALDFVKNTLVDMALPGKKLVDILVGDQKATESVKKAKEALDSRNRTSLALQGETTRARQADEKALASQTTAEKKAAAAKAKAAKEAAEAAKKAAKAARQALLDEAKATLESYKQIAADYVNSIRDAITGTISLADAVSNANQSVADKEAAVTSALQNRKQAYDALNLAQQTNDVEAYNQALQDLAKAEQDVAKASTMQTTDYTTKFREQIQAAKDFAGNLQTLIQRGLLGAGVQQLLNLGAVAGNAVAKDMIAGTNGSLTVGELNNSLQAVSDAGTAAGMATPWASSLLGASVGSGRGNTFNINVTAGVGDKVAIAKEIVDALQEFGRVNGGIPILVS